ncbi:hypothetical protein LSAT2_005700, partial [Lamellibrachia satsuma]
ALDPEARCDSLTLQLLKQLPKLVTSVLSDVETDSFLQEVHSAPQGTRWMASRQRAFTALRHNLTAVCLHMEDAATGKGGGAAKCRGYFGKLRSLDFKKALH